MKKHSFIVKIPIHQIYSSGLSWAQINELSWEEFNLLSWKDLAALARRYVSYSIQFPRKLITNATITARITYLSKFAKKIINEVIFTLKKVR